MQLDNKDMPLVSVLMTAYNREDYISEAIESVLASTYKNFELIIVDDCSTDNTLAIAESYKKKDARIKVYLNEKNLKDYPNRNRAASYAMGKYIKYLDSDDTIYDWGLAYCVEMMEKYPDAGMGVSHNKSEIQQEFLPSKEAINQNFFVTPILNIGPSGTIMKKDAFDKIGYFDPGYGVPSDMFFNLKMAAYFPIVLLKKSYFFYRVHEGQEINNKYSYLCNNYRYIADALKLPCFPLSGEEKKYMLSKCRRGFVIGFLGYIKNTGDIKAAVKAFKLSGIGITGFLRGIFQ
jgi:glycosyltransferase involved in cell wall biosynthesis